MAINEGTPAGFNSSFEGEITPEKEREIVSRHVLDTLDVSQGLLEGSLDNDLAEGLAISAELLTEVRVVPVNRVLNVLQALREEDKITFSTVAKSDGEPGFNVVSIERKSDLEQAA